MRGSFVSQAALGAAVCVVGAGRAARGRSPAPSPTTGKVPSLKPLAVAAEPMCAKKHATVPNEVLVLGAGNTMANVHGAGRERPAGRQDLAGADDAGGRWTRRAASTCRT